MSLEKITKNKEEIVEKAVENDKKFMEILNPRHGLSKDVIR